MVVPVISGRKKMILGAQQSANLAKWMSFRFREGPGSEQSRAIEEDVPDDLWLPHTCT